ncbi:MAG: coiled-coil domain-containing protein [Candidatus Zhuqueibacterota bacterium]
MLKKVILRNCCLLVFLAALCQNAFAQSADSLRAELAWIKKNQETKLQELDALLQELKAKIERQEKQDEMKKLLDEVTKLSTLERKKQDGLGKKFYSGTRQQSGLNPNISLGGDFFSAVSSSHAEFINEPSEISYGNNRFALREVELSLIAPLDPFTRGKTHLSLSDNGLSIEETYMEWLNLPANLNLKIGVFYAEFGILNRYHDHALPQFDRPKVLLTMFGTAPIGGMGFAGNFLLPTMLFSDASSLELAVVRGGDDISFTSEGKFNLLGIGHFKNYYDITRNTYVEWSVSAAAGKNDPEERYASYIGDVGLSVRWVPIGRDKYRTIDWQTEFLFSRRETPAGEISSKGIYTSLQNKINALYWVSGRIGYAELPFDHSQNVWDFTATFDVWQSEFVFYRFQYQYTQRQFTNYLQLAGPYPDDHTFLFQVSWAMGPHKHERY